MTEGGYPVHTLLPIGEQDADTRHELLTRLAAVTPFGYTGRGEPPASAPQALASFIVTAPETGTFHLSGVQPEAFTAGSCAGLLATVQPSEALSAVLDPDFGIIRTHWDLPNVGNCHLGPHGRTAFLVAYQIGLSLPRPTARLPLEHLLLDVLA